MGVFDMLGGKYDVDEKSAEIDGYQQMQQQYQQGAQAAGGRQGASMTAATLGQAGEAFRGRQVSLADALAAQANGQGPSLAQSQLQRATSNNLAQSLAMMNSQRGAGRGGALRAVAYQQGALNAQAGADSATLALQEQMAARNQLGQVLAGGRGQDIALAGENANLQQGANSQNLAAEMQQRGLNDALVSRYLQMGMTLAMAQQQARAELERTKAGAYEGSANRGYGVAQNLARGGASAISGGIDAMIPGL